MAGWNNIPIGGLPGLFGAGGGGGLFKNSQSQGGDFWDKLLAAMPQLGAVGAGMLENNPPGGNFSQSLGGGMQYANEMGLRNQLAQERKRRLELDEQEAEARTQERLSGIAKEDKQRYQVGKLFGTEPASLFGPTPEPAGGLFTQSSGGSSSPRLTPQQVMMLQTYSQIDPAGVMKLAADWFGPQDPLKAPASRTINRGGTEVTEEWNPQTGAWSEIASGPRWNPKQEGSELTLAQRQHNMEVYAARRNIRARYPGLDPTAIRSRINPDAMSFNPSDSELRRTVHMAGQSLYGADPDFSTWSALTLEPEAPTSAPPPMAQDWGQRPAPGSLMSNQAAPTPTVSGQTDEATIMQRAQRDELSLEELKSIKANNPGLYRRLIEQFGR